MAHLSPDDQPDHDSTQTGAFRAGQPPLIWLVPFTFACVYLSADYSSVNTPGRWIASGVVVATIGYVSALLCSEPRPGGTPPIVRRSFLLASTLGLFVLSTRLAFPLTSHAESDPNRLHGILNLWMAVPFAGLAVLSAVLLVALPGQRKSFVLWCMLILMSVLSLSLEP